MGELKLLVIIYFWSIILFILVRTEIGRKMRLMIVHFRYLFYSSSTLFENGTLIRQAKKHHFSEAVTNLKDFKSI